jgi:hypothetical protein
MTLVKRMPPPFRQTELGRDVGLGLLSNTVSKVYPKEINTEVNFYLVSAGSGRILDPSLSWPGEEGLEVEHCDEEEEDFDGVVPDLPKKIQKSANFSNGIQK